MDIQRVDTYTDPRFPQEVLYQHGAFLADGLPYAFRVVSGHEAVVSGPDLGLAALEDGTLCVLDGHTQLYEAWRRGIRTAMVFDVPGWKELSNFVQEARKRGIYHIRDLAFYSPEEQKKNWHDWCDAYFAAQGRTEEE